MTWAAAIPVFMIPALEWLPWISEGMRPWLILPSLAVAALAFFFLNRHERSLDGVFEENLNLRAGINNAEPEYLLRQIAATLFREGAWRLTVYRKSHSPADGDFLTKLCSVASDVDQQDLSASGIAIVPNTMFEFSFRSNLADPNFRRPEQSGHAPEDVYDDEWAGWRDGIFGPSAIIDDTSTFHARKIAWYAAQDPDRQAVFVAIAESAAPEGIAVDYLDHTFTPAWLFFVSRIAELRNSAATQ